MVTVLESRPKPTSRRNGQHTATHCDTCVAPLCNTLQYNVTHRNTATHWNILQHTATHCNTLQHTATHCNTLQHTAAHCNTLLHTATHCNTCTLHQQRSSAVLHCTDRQQLVDIPGAIGGNFSEALSYWVGTPPSLGLSCFHHVFARLSSEASKSATGPIKSG